MTVHGIQPVSKMKQILAASTDPKETKQVEEMAAASRAWAKEHQDFDVYVNSAFLYVLARRRTTELVMPHIQHGGHNKQGFELDTLQDFGFTKSQWTRRCKEFELELSQIEEYFEECFSNGWWPSINGLFRFKQGTPDAEPCICPACGKEHTRMT